MLSRIVTQKFLLILISGRVETLNAVHTVLPHLFQEFIQSRSEFLKRFSASALLYRMSEYRYAAFRAHDAVPTSMQGRENVLDCELFREIEDAFSIVVQFYEKGNANRTENALMTYETDKATWQTFKENGDPLRLRIPEDAVIWLEK